MNHRTYDAQRYAPLDKINTGNVKNLKLAYSVAIGGTAINENLESTPLAEDGFLYVVDLWGIVYKIDARAGDLARVMWRMDPKQEKAPDANRGVALWGNFVISIANHPPRLIATNKETGRSSGKPTCPTARTRLQFTAAPLPVKDKIIVGAAGGDNGVRDFILAADAATGKVLWRQIRRSRRRANPARTPGRTRTTPGRPVAAPCGSPAPMIPIPTRCCGAPGIRCRGPIPITGPATTSTPTA